MKATALLVSLLAIWVSCNCSLGQTWVQTSAPNTNWWSIACSKDGTRLIAATAWGYIHISTDSGTTWSSNYFAPFVDACVASSHDGKVLAVAGWGDGTNGCIVSTNWGCSWTAVTNMSTAWWHAVAMSADGYFMAAAAAPSQFLLSTNYGMSWNIGSIGIGGDKGGWGLAACSANGTRVAISQPGSGALWYSTNAGTSWVCRLSGPPLMCLRMSADGTVLVVGTAGTIPAICVSTNSGMAWTTNTFSGVDMVFSVTCSADGRQMAASIGSYYTDDIVISTDFGQTWQPSGAPVQYWHSICASADFSKLAAAVPRTGYIWTSQTPPAPRMNMTRVNRSLNLTWVFPSVPFTLQQTSNLTDWLTVTDAVTLNMTNFQYHVSLPISSGNRFYRLKSP